MNLNEIELSEKQAEYIVKANKRWNVKVGATQCGKTYIDTLYLIQSRIINRRGLKGLVFIVGVSKETIQRNIIEPMQEIWGNKLISDINSKNEATIFGEKCYCLGADNKGRVRKFRGARIKYLYIDEVVDIDEEVFRIFPSRLSFEYSCADCAGNPQHSTHWFKNFIDRDDLDIYVQHYTLFDNPFLPIKYVTELCKEYEGTVYYQRYILGLWANAEGLIYKQFADNLSRYKISKQEYCKKMGIDLKSLFNHFDSVNIGIDFGGNGSKHAMSCSGRRRNNLVAIKSRTIVAKGVTLNQLIEQIKTFALEMKEQFPNLKYIYCDNAESTMINSIDEELRKYGFFVTGSYKLPINDRIRALCILLGADRFCMFEDNKELELSLCQAIWDSKYSEDKRLDDFSYCVDILDAFEYSYEGEINRLIEGGI